MSKGYLVGHIKVHDRETFAKFREQANLVLEEHGGKILLEAIILMLEKEKM